MTYPLTHVDGARCAVAIGASAGGVTALRTVVHSLPSDLPAAVFIVMHLDPRARSMLPMLLASATGLRFGDVHLEGRAEERTIYVAIPDHHLFVLDRCVRLGTSAPMHHVRPAVDTLFDSVASTWAEAAVGVVLTGNGHDGASGIASIKAHGGVTIAQDPRDAEYPSMPRAAIATGHVDTVVPLAGIGDAISRAANAAAARAAAG